MLVENPALEKGQFQMDFHTQLEDVFSYLCCAVPDDDDGGVGPPPVEEALLLLRCSYVVDAAAAVGRVIDVVGLCLDSIPFVVAACVCYIRIGNKI